MKKLLFIFTWCMIPTFIHARVGCINNSFRLDHTKGPDYKLWHYVACDCPCEAHYQQRIDKQGTICLKCGHHHADPSPIYVTEMPSEHQEHRK